jgi:hypothetical protein
MGRLSKTKILEYLTRKGKIPPGKKVTVLLYFEKVVF